MNTMNKFFMFLAIMALSSGYTIIQAQEQAVEMKSMAEFESRTYDFGKIEQGKPVKAVFKVKNTSMVPLLITKVSPTCGCTVANYTKEPIKPGETGTIESTYDARAMGRFAKTIHVTTNSSEPRIDLYLKGEVVPKKQMTDEEGNVK
jgi:hypothetical protein